MKNTKVQDFLNSLTKEQRTAVLACRTEEELNKAMGDLDIELTEEMLDGVTGGKGFMPVLMASIMALSGGAAVLGSTSAIQASAYVSQTTDTKDAIEDYFDSLNYDEDTLYLSHMETDGTTKTSLVKNSDGTAYLVKKVRSTEHLTPESFGVANADVNAIYPGALLAADENLVTGNPTPLVFRRSDIEIGISDANVENGKTVTTTVNPTKASSVTNGINELKQRFKEGTDFAAQTTAKIEKVESSEQIKAKMNISEKMWGELKISAEADYQTKQQAVLVDINQVFYTVYADLTTGADLFADGVTVDDVKKQITNEKPAVMVSSVDYGKRIVACIQTDDTSFDLKAAVEASGLGGKVSGNAEAEYHSKLSSCKVRVFVLGGSSSASGKYITTNMDDLIKLASESTGYDGFAKPISYTTRYAKSGRIATTNYYGDVWETHISEARHSIPATLSFNGITGSQSEGIRSKTINVYGRRIVDMDENGNYIYGNEELLKSQTSNAVGDIGWTLDADVDLGSVWIEFKQESVAKSPGKQKFNGIEFDIFGGFINQITKKIYLKDIVADTENTGKYGQIIIGVSEYGLPAGGIKFDHKSLFLDAMYHPQVGYATIVEKGEGLAMIDNIIEATKRMIKVDNAPY
jgi:hypothetical protein